MEEEEVKAVAETEDHIDIVGESAEETKPAERKQGERKTVKRGGCFGPEQFTEEDVQAGVAGKEGEERERSDQDQSQWCSQCQASTHSNFPILTNQLKLRLIFQPPLLFRVD